MIVEKIKSYIEGLPDCKSPVAELRMSMAGDCPRKIHYDFTFGRPAVSFQNYMRMETGSALHEMFHKIMRGAYGAAYNPETECYAYHAPTKTTIKGHCDGTIGNMVIEFKAVADSTFMLVKKEGKPLDAHIIQANMYAMGLGKDMIAVVYFNKDAGLFHEFIFEADRDVVTHALEKMVSHADRERAAPPRPQNDITEAPCFYCDHKERCYSGFERELAEMGIVDIEATDWQALAHDLFTHRKERLAQEKLEESAKSKMFERMFKEKVNVARLKDVAVFTLKSGKNNNPLLTTKEVKSE